MKTPTAQHDHGEPEQPVGAGDIVISVQNLTKKYRIFSHPGDRIKQALTFGRVRFHREFTALQDVSFEIKKGEAVGIIGRNGSGKSTLLQLICGILKPTSGRIQVNGRISALLELGSGFNPDFTGRENVYLNGVLLGLSREQIDERYDAIASFADIGKYLNQPVKTYSSGMLVRLAFAVQVQVEPDILIVDEALAVGDALFQKRCFERIEKLVSDGTTLLFVSHEQESIRTLTNRVLLLKEGRQIAWGLSSDVVLEYRRILHEEEKEYYRGRLLRKQVDDFLPAKPDIDLKRKHQKLKSFGYLEAEILDVHVFNSNEEESSYFHIGDEVVFQIRFRANIALIGLNVAFRIRNKEGVKVTSWGTLNDDIRKFSAARSINDLFWSRQFKPGEVATVRFRMKCPLGSNLYELQVTVTKEHDMHYGVQEILHWKDEAAFFTIDLKPKEYIVGGICDLGFDCEVLSE